MLFFVKYYFFCIPFFKVVFAIILFFTVILACIFYYVLTKEIISTGDYLAFTNGDPSLISTVLLYAIVSSFPVATYVFRLIALKTIPKAYATMFPDIISDPKINAYLEKWR